MSRPPSHPPAVTSASQPTSLAYVPSFGRQPEDFLLDPQQPTQSQEGSPAQQLPLSSPPNPRKRKAPKSPPMAEIPSDLTPGYGPSSGYAAQVEQGEQQPEAPTQAPAPKKSRTNTPWTPAEEQRLKTMRDAGNSWSEIGKVRICFGRVSSQTDEDLVQDVSQPDRRECEEALDMHYADFAEDESAALLAAIKEYEASKWKVIGAKVGKPAKACEQYAKEHFGGRT
ncbi:MAG: hypothetical protein Q9171_005270 [Xanthocarpia ochracea]